MLRLMCLTMLLLVPLVAVAQEPPTIPNDWAEADISGYTRISSPVEIMPSISMVYFFGNKGIGLQYSGLNSSTQEAGALGSYRVWSMQWGETKQRALHVHILGRWMNEIGDKLDLSKGDIGFEVRPDFDISNKFTSAIRILWSMQDGANPRITAGFGVQFQLDSSE